MGVCKWDVLNLGDCLYLLHCGFKMLYCADALSNSFTQIFCLLVYYGVNEIRVLQRTSTD